MPKTAYYTRIYAIRQEIDKLDEAYWSVDDYDPVRKAEYNNARAELQERLEEAFNAED